MRKTIKFMSGVLALAMCLSMMPMSAFALDNWENAVPGGENEVDVTLTIDESWRVKIPKTIELDAESKSAEYSVEVNGNIAGTKQIKVAPDASFLMTQDGKDDITATITQEKQAVASAEIESGSVVTLDGSISAPSATSGTWNGSFNFNIALEDAVELISFTATIGLDHYETYQAEKGMTWEQWVNSKYNTDGFIIRNGEVVTSAIEYTPIVSLSTSTGPENNEHYGSPIL